MGASKIEWTDRVWNATRGCTRISPGCERCYAERQAIRQAGPGGRYEDLVKSTPNGPRWTGRVAVDEGALAAPLRWRGPLRVFVDSMSDLFHEDVPDAFVDRVFAVMALCPTITFQVLTKRPERMRAYLCDRGLNERTARASVFLVPNKKLSAKEIDPDWQQGATAGWHRWPLPNVHLGVSVENQTRAVERVPVLLATPAAVRFVSAEPLLEQLDLSPWLRRFTRFHLEGDIEGLLRSRSFGGLTNGLGTRLTPAQAEVQLRLELDAGNKFIPVGAGCHEFDPKTGCPGHRQPRVDWVIVGGESGPGARPTDVAWIRSIVEQCRGEAVPVFVKQVGARPRASSRAELERWPFASRAIIEGLHREDDYEDLRLENRKGGDPDEWPESLRVREFPGMEVAP